MSYLNGDLHHGFNTNKKNRLKAKGYLIINGKLHVPQKAKSNVFVPVICVEDIFDTLYQIHCIDRGHTGQDITIDQVQNRYYGIPRKIIRVCSVCNLKSISVSKKYCSILSSMQFKINSTFSNTIASKTLL
jgi:hypothetical protein